MSTADITPLLAAFALTGHWGPLAMNVPLNDVTAAWGPPTTEAPISKRHAWPRLMAYGDIEVSVCNCRHVDLICIQTWRETIDVPAADNGKLTRYLAALSHETITEALTAAGCPWKVDPQLTFGSQCAVLAGALDVSFVFEIPDDGIPVLNVAGVHRPRHPCRPSA